MQHNWNGSMSILSWRRFLMIKFKKLKSVCTFTVLFLLFYVQQQFYFLKSNISEVINDILHAHPRRLWFIVSFIYFPVVGLMCCCRGSRVVLNTIFILKIMCVLINLQIANKATAVQPVFDFGSANQSFSKWYMFSIFSHISFAN